MLDVMGPETPAWGKGIKKGRHVLVKVTAGMSTDGQSKLVGGSKRDHHGEPGGTLHGKVGQKE